MSRYQDLIDRGYNPDAENTRGYVCRDCGYKPTEIELDEGRCPLCWEEKLASMKASGASA